MRTEPRVERAVGAWTVISCCAAVGGCARTSVARFTGHQAASEATRAAASTRCRVLAVVALSHREIPQMDYTAAW